GEYSVRVSNAVDTVFSDKAVLTVTEPPPPAITKISHLHTLLDPDNFLPTDTATIFTSEGIVTTHINLTGTADALFYFQDDTGGIAVFVAGGAGVVPPAGAKVRVTAPLTHFNGLLEFRVTASNSDHKVVTLSTGNPLPEPLTLDLGAFAAPDPTAIEPIEGRLVQAVNVTLDTSTPNFRTGGENVTITDESGNPFTLRVDARTDIGGQVKPTGPVTIIGVLAQFDTSNPRTTGYQIIPSRFADILSSTKAPLIRFTNTLERLIRPGDQVVNTFVEHALHPGEKLTMEVAITDSENRVVTITADSSNLPASARWTLGATTGTSLSATFTFEPTANDAGKNVVVTLEARNDAAVNTATWTIYVPTAIESNVILSEFLPNPSSMATAPHFNPLNRTSPSPNASYEDEYVELANLNAADVDLVGWTIADSVQIRHKFYESFSVTSSNAIVVFGGPLDATFAPSLDVPNLPASEAVFGFGLNNGGDAILLRNAEGHLISRVVYSAADVSNESSLTRYPNLNGAFIAHAKVTSNYVSPGKQWNNRPFSEPAPSDPKPFSVIASRGAAGQVILKWTAEPGRTYSVWQASAISGPFASLATGLSFTNTEAEYTDNSLGNAGTRFYRVSTP
ncbi:MAG: lamin tail domain-containing protein, partial [Verrucomicrobiota bacterium]